VLVSATRRAVSPIAHVSASEAIERAGDGRAGGRAKSRLDKRALVPIVPGSSMRHSATIIAGLMIMIRFESGRRRVV
jgi:hypothetical protein